MFTTQRSKNKFSFLSHLIRVQLSYRTVMGNSKFGPCLYPLSLDFYPITFLVLLYANLLPLPLPPHFSGVLRRIVLTSGLGRKADRWGL